jgi:hypothetical protein
MKIKILLYIIISISIVFSSIYIINKIKSKENIIQILDNISKDKNDEHIKNKSLNDYMKKICGIISYTLNGGGW